MGAILEVVAFPLREPPSCVFKVEEDPTDNQINLKIGCQKSLFKAENNRETEFNFEFELAKWDLISTLPRTDALFDSQPLDWDVTCGD